MIFIVLAGLSVQPGYGQATTSAVVGTVTDASGATIPNTTVTITNLNTNDTRSVVTNETGAYLFENLLPGRYSISIKHENFVTVNVSNLILSAGDRRRQDAMMRAGGTTTTVEVETTAPVLQTDASAVASTVTEQAVQSLPLNGRNFIQLTQLVAGANEGPPNGLSSGQRPDDRRQSSSVSVNGQSDVINDQLIDGMDNNERIIGSVGVRPSIDSISEVRVLTNSYEADSGRAAGAVINIITKSGTNKFHGSAYEYFRNDALNAYAFQFGAHNPKPELRQNQFGGSLGGPILRNRTFFFGDIEAFRLVQGTSPTSNVVPTAYEKAHPGDFSDNIPTGCKQNPTPGTPNPTSQTSGCVYDTVTGNLIASNIVPVSQRDPAGLLYFSLYPAPNSGINRYVGVRNKTQFSTVYDIRIDHKISDNDSIFGRYTSNSIDTFFPSNTNLPITQAAGLTLDPGAGYNGQSPQDARNIQINYTHVFTPQLLMLVAAGYTFIDNLSNPSNIGLNPNKAFGQPNMNISKYTSALAPIQVTGGTNLGIGGSFLPLNDKNHVYQINGSVVYSHGLHSFKTGAALIRRTAFNQQDAEGEGRFTFAAGYPGLVSGFFSAATRNNNLYPPYYQTWEPSVFFQDNWHALKNLTLNLGVRYDVFTPFTEKNNHISNFDPTTATIIQAGVNGISRTAGVKTDYSSIAPRIGFAYSVRPSLVVRGGFGLAFFPGNLASPANLKNQPNTATYGTCTSVSYLTNPVTCPAAYTRMINGFPLPVASNAANPVGSIPASEALNFRSSYLEQFNLTVQKDFRGNTASISYVGSLGRHLSYAWGDVNRVAPGTTTRRFASQLPNVTTIAQLVSSGASNYHSLQGSFERRFSNGLGFNANATWAHNTDNVNGISGGGGGGLGQVLATQHIDDYGNSDLNQAGRYVVTGNYMLPFGKSWTGAKGYLGKGWQINLINVWSTGLPTNAVNSTNRSGTSPNGGADRPNQVLPNSKLNQRTITQWFNTAAYQNQPIGTIGTARRNQIIGPNYRHLDVSVFKDMVFEHVTLQFRAEAFNVANQANFALPNVQVGNPIFGQITSTNVNYNPRLFQFVMRLTF